MKAATFVLLGNAIAAVASAIPPADQAPLNTDVKEPEERYLIELGPSELRWVTEDEKWRIRRVSFLFKE